ncbi:MAG: NAD(P)/FAD-dependent oxidoreductase [Nitrospinota bacterium]|nr:NAD(P)/FAD-dependent oxidoreductase [Nitrospinota bacterium]
MKRIVILGAGTGGTILANTLSRKLTDWQITIVDNSKQHVYQPGLLFIPFRLHGYETREDVTKPIKRHLPEKVEFVSAQVLGIDHAANKVQTSAGIIEYDWLIMALGCSVDPEAVEGLPEAMGKTAQTFYTLEGAMALQKALDGFKEGRVMLSIAEMPIKCPVAPIEFVFMADYYFTLKGIRERVEIELVTPLTGAFTKPVATHVLNEIAAGKNIKIRPNFDIASVDNEKKTISSFSGESFEYDLLVTIPPNVGPEVIDDSGLGNGAGFALTHPGTLKSKKADNIYVLGDNTDVPTSKAGSVTHFEAEIVEANLLREISGQSPIPDFDGHSNCFIESGFGKALLIDFNYEVEPLPGSFPLSKVGPFSLLKETRLNHWGKLAFKQVYWNLLLTGHLPGDPLLPATMSMDGKDLSQWHPHHG